MDHLLRYGEQIGMANRTNYFQVAYVLLILMIPAIEYMRTTGIHKRKFDLNDPLHDAKGDPETRLKHLFDVLTPDLFYIRTVKILMHCCICLMGISQEMLSKLI